MSTDHRNGILSRGLCVLAATFCGALVFFAAAVGLAAFMSARGIVYPVRWAFATAALILGSMTAGFVLACLQKHGGLLCGAVEGGLFGALSLALRLWQNEPMDTAATLRLVLILVGGCAGGFLGVLCAERPRRHRAAGTS